MLEKITYVILDNVRSAFNVGSIFRTSDAAKITCIYLIGITPKPPLEKLNKTSIGSIKYVQWKYFPSIEEAINDIKQIDLTHKIQTKIISVELTENSSMYNEVDLSIRSVGFIFGHEINGVSAKSIDLSDNVVQLPMLGFKNSLNVATTTGIILYERLRQSSK